MRNRYFFSSSFFCPLPLFFPLAQLLFLRRPPSLSFHSQTNKKTGPLPSANSRTTAKMTPCSSRSRTSALSVCAAAAVVAVVASLASLATAAQQPSSLDRAVAALYPDPSPSKRGVGDQLYTTLSSNQTNSSISALIKGNAAASALKGKKKETKRGQKDEKKQFFFLAQRFFFFF